MAVGVWCCNKYKIQDQLLYQPSNTHSNQAHRTSQDRATVRGSLLIPHSPQRVEKGVAMGAGPRRLTFLVGEAEYWSCKSNSLSLSRLSPALFLSSRTRDRAFFLHASPELAPPLPRCISASAIPALSSYPSPPGAARVVQGIASSGWAACFDTVVFARPKKTKSKPPRKRCFT